MFSRILMLLAAGALLSACVTTYGAQTQTIVSLVGGGLTTRTEVAVPPYTTFNSSDGAYCESYQVRQYNLSGHVRYGAATVCRYTGHPWYLASRQFTTAWLPTSAPVPSPSYPVSNPSYPADNPQQNPINPAIGPAPVPGQPGQWVPVVQ